MLLLHYAITRSVNSTALLFSLPFALMKAYCKLAKMSVLFSKVLQQLIKDFGILLADSAKFCREVGTAGNLPYHRKQQSDCDLPISQQGQV